MPCLVSFEGFGEEERSPVRETADYAAISEDEGTGCAGNSNGKAVLVTPERQLG